MFLNRAVQLKVIQEIATSEGEFNRDDEMFESLLSQIKNNLSDTRTSGGPRHLSQADTKVPQTLSAVGLVPSDPTNAHCCKFGP